MMKQERDKGAALPPLSPYGGEVGSGRGAYVLQTV